MPVKVSITTGLNKALQEKGSSPGQSGGSPYNSTACPDGARPVSAGHTRLNIFTHRQTGRQTGQMAPQQVNTTPERAATGQTGL